MNIKQKQIIEILDQYSKLIGVDSTKVDGLSHWLSQCKVEPLSMDELMNINNLTLEDIASSCGMIFGLTLEQMQEDDRTTPRPLARQLYTYFARKVYPKSIDWQVMDIVKRNRSTVHHSIRVIENRIEIGDKETIDHVDRITKTLIKKGYINEDQAA